LIVTAVISLLAGIAGYSAAKAGVVQLMGSLAHRVPSAKQLALLADLWVHLAAYGVGFFGGIMLSIWILFRRRRLARLDRKSLSLLAS
jgi:hypothetical protein